MKPTFLILGATKAGTTTLHAMLGMHPEIFVTPRKEPPFFDAEYDRGLEYYWRTYYADWCGQPASGEARPCKLYLDYVAPRIRESLPDAKLIVMLRDPVARCYSHWWDRQSRGKEPLPFRRALDANLRDLEVEGRFVGREGERRWLAGLSPDKRFSTVRTFLDAGHYATHLSRYLALFPREQIGVFWLEDLIADPAAVLAAVWRFLGVSDSAPVPSVHRNAAMSASAAAAWRVMFRNRLHYVVPRRVRHWIRDTLSEWGGRPPMDDADRAWLSDYYAPHDERLRTLLSASRLAPAARSDALAAERMPAFQS